MGRASKIDAVLDAVLNERHLQVRYERFDGEERRLQLKPIHSPSRAAECMSMIGGRRT
jgi:hypothetical protein